MSEAGAILDALPGAAAVLDEDGTIVLVNEAWGRFSEANGGPCGDAYVGTSYLDSCDPETRRGVEAVVRGERDAYEIDYPCHAPGIERWFRLTVGAWPEGGVLVLHQNVTTDHMRLRRVVHGAPGGIIEITADGMTAWVSEGWERITGQRGIAPGQWWDALAEVDRVVVRKAIANALAHGRPFSIDARLAGNGLAGRWVRLTARVDSVGPTVVISAVDISEERLYTHQLAHLAHHDSLTGLPNRSLFVEHLTNAVAALGRPGSAGVSVCFLDLDDFKEVNDTHGHDIGDRLLRSVASRLRQAMRPSDVVARFGGDEFLALLINISATEAAEIAERVRGLLSAPVLLGDVSLTPSASIGVAHTTKVVDIEALIQSADLALYRAKDDGKSRVRSRAAAGEIAPDRAPSRIVSDRALIMAPQRGSIATLVQAIVDVRTRAVVGAEALMAWDDGDRRLPASAFIDRAAELGILPALSHGVFRTAVRTWARDPSLGVLTANLAPEQLQQADLASVLISACDESGLTLDRLVIEITETTALLSHDVVEANLRAISESGIRVALDDFGSGFSSLSRLRHLPFDILKIDRSLVTGISGDPDGRAILRGVATMARQLDRTLVAEGCEDVADLDILLDAGVSLVQGFALHRPQPIADYVAERGHV